MKKTKIIFTVFFTLLLICAMGATVLFGVEKDGNGEWLILNMTVDQLQTYVKEDILPPATAIATAVATIYVAIVPAINRIKSASGKFEKATEDVNCASERARESKECVTKMGEELRLDMMNVKDEYSALEKKIDDVERILLIAFKNNKELTANGGAAAIAKILNQEELVADTEKGEGNEREEGN